VAYGRCWEWQEGGGYITGLSFGIMILNYMMD